MSSAVDEIDEFCDRVPAADNAPLIHPASESPLTVIKPTRGWRVVNLRELWRYRELLVFLTWRDIKVRYKQTVLGAAWAVLQPLAMMVVFSMFMGQVVTSTAGALAHYPLFAFTGLLPWTLFATAITSAGTSVVANQNLVTKVYFPRLIIPISAAGAAPLISPSPPPCCWY